MSDGKYGRLFTEEDVRNIAVNASSGDVTDSDIDTAIESLDAKGELKFPADEPLMLFRAQDRLAIGAVRAYETLCLASKHVPEDQKNLVGSTYRQFDAFRAHSPERIKYPD